MPVNKYHILLLMLLTCSSCIEPFEPVIKESPKVLVINGKITDQPGMHYVGISRSTPYRKPSYQPVSGYVVSVTDENGEMILFNERENGKYSADIPGSFLAVGKAYRLQVFTPNQREYCSEYDTLLACPPIDSIYYEVETRETSDPDFILGGIQFYLDMTGSASDSRDFMWQLEETWEYWAALFSQYIRREGEEVISFHSNDHFFKCWKTYPIGEIYTKTTRNLSVNALKRNSLNFVSNETDRLKVKYSLLVKQQSLTRRSYVYWEKMRAQSRETGGLYETQPSSAIGNIYNTTDPDEVVLGIFYATQQRTKRIMVDNISGENDPFEFKIPYLTCEWEDATSTFQSGDNFPYYLKSNNPSGYGSPYLTADRICFDCRIRGGINVKPDYW
ncbi:MAG: DUF4249 domain-containing protein [Bacteroidetes bacterium]|nr:DUF4249 domain-containing protein [Bacteroidota bacterium]